MNRITTAAAIGLVSAIPAAFVIAGWLLREPAVIRLVPGARSRAYSRVEQSRDSTGLAMARQG